MKSPVFFDISRRQKYWENVDLDVFLHQRRSSSWARLLPYVRAQRGPFCFLRIFFTWSLCSKTCPSIFTPSKLLQRSPVGRCKERASLSRFFMRRARLLWREQQSRAGLSTFRHLISAINADVPSGGPSVPSTCRVDWNYQSKTGRMLRVFFSVLV